MSLLKLTQFGVQRGARDVLRDVDLAVNAGEVVGIIGPNGAGKTTLMRAALGLLPHSGSSSLAALSPSARGRAVAWLPQAREIAWPVSVHQLVLLGRIPYSGQKASGVDDAAVAAALTKMELDPFATRIATQLSGGEQARALIARALAQETPLLMADEPIAGLDPAHQISTMQTFQTLAAEGRSVIVSLHDLGLAARHCTRLIVLDKGGIAADGPPLDVLTADLLRRVFGIRASLDLTKNGLIFQPLEVVT